jgi:hypothetical protein
VKYFTLILKEIKLFGLKLNKNKTAGNITTIVQGKKLTLEEVNKYLRIAEDYKNNI